MKIIDLNKNYITQIAKLEENTFSNPWSEDAFLKELDDKNKITLITLSKDNKLIGFVNAWVVLDEVSINNIAVDKNFQRQGVATSLLKALNERVKDLSFITLEVRKSNTQAIKLYEKNGYKRVGERKNFYRDPTEPAILMTKTLKGDIQ